MERLRSAARALRTIAAIRTGDYSYGLYVFAFPIQQLIASGPGAGHPWLSLLVTVPVTALLAFLSWHLIEAPALSLKKPHRPRPEMAET